MSQMKSLVILAAVAALAACASNIPAPVAAASAFAGYQQVVVKGTPLFCKYEAVTGSLIRQQTCFTKAQLEAQQRNSQSYVQQAQRYSSSCAAAGGLVPGGGDNCQP